MKRKRENDNTSPTEFPKRKAFITQDITKRIVCGVEFQTLFKYFKRKFKNNFRDMFNPFFSNKNQRFLEVHFIYVSKEFEEVERKIFEQNDCSNRIDTESLLNMVIEENLPSFQKGCEHVLSFGYSRRNPKKHQKEFKASTSSAYNLSSQFVNNTVEHILNSSGWYTLHKIVGDDEMKFLLSNACIFYKFDLKMGNFMQVTGRIIHKYIPKGSKKPLSWFKKKSVSVKYEIQRKGMLYSNFYSIVNMFHKSHPLNSITSDAENLNFYKQVFFLAFDRHAKGKDFVYLRVFREIRRKQLKVSKHVLFLLDKHCPLNIPKARETQAMIPVPPNEEQTKSQKYETLISSFSEVYCVFKFLKSVVMELIPKYFWGSKHNQKIFEDALLHFVKIGKNERFYLENVMKGLRVKSMKWLFGNAGRMARLAMLAREEAVRRFMVFFFEGLIIPLVKSYFYVTENSKSQKSLFYYRKKIVWSQITKISFKDLYGADTFREINSEEVDAIRLSWEKIFQPKRNGGPNRSFFALTKNGLEFPSLRPLPKADSVRGIVNLGKKMRVPNGKDKKYAVSINSLLKNIRQIMKLEIFQNPANLGGSMFHFHDIYYRVQPFFKRLHEENIDPKGNLFCAGFDLRHAYDNINHEKLLDIVKNCFSKQYYEIRRFIRTNHVGGNVYPVFDRVASDDPNSLMELMKNEFRTGVVYIDTTETTSVNSKDVMKKVEFHVTKHVVKLRDKYYLQVRGIPQGSTLSPMLCNLLYGDLEKTRLSHLPGINNLTIDNKSFGVLNRMFDDSLYITNNRHLCETMIKLLYAGFEEYGAEINEKKTKLNFNCSFRLSPGGGEEKVFNKQRWLCFCGLLVDCEEWQWRSSYQRFLVGSLRETITVMFNPSKASISNQLSQTISSRLGPILLDNLINKEFTILLNIYQCMLFIAMKFHILVTRSGFKDLNSSHLEIFKGVVKYTHNFIRKWNKTIEKAGSRVLLLSQNLILTLGVKAWLVVLQRKFNSHRLLVDQLKNKDRGILDIIPQFKMLIEEVIKEKHSEDLFQIKY